MFQKVPQLHADVWLSIIAGVSIAILKGCTAEKPMWRCLQNVKYICCSSVCCFSAFTDVLLPTDTGTANPAGGNPGQVPPMVLGVATGLAHRLLEAGSPDNEMFREEADKRIRAIGDPLDKWLSGFGVTSWASTQAGQEVMMELEGAISKAGNLIEGQPEQVRYRKTW